jgi:hypothetical protein
LFVLKGSCDVLDVEECQNCITGQQECSNLQPTCWYKLFTINFDYFNNEENTVPNFGLLKRASTW